MTFARSGLIVVVLSLVSGAARADDQVSPADRQAAVQRMVAWTHLPARAVVGVTPEVAVALVGRGSPGPKRGQFSGVEVQGEVLDEGLVQARGWRSMRLKLDVACPDRSTWVRQMQVYDDHNRGGAGRNNAVPSGWVRPKAEASLGQVVTAICGPPSDNVVEASSAGLRPAPAPIAPPPSPLAAPSPVASQIHPARPAVAPSPRMTLRGITATPNLSGITVQIAAAATEGDARRALAGAATGLMLADPNLTFRVDQGEVAGRVVYRAVIAGFTGRKAALDWCESLRKAGDACFVR
jgi:hypothetical protein